MSCQSPTGDPVADNDKECTMLGINQDVYYNSVAAGFPLGTQTHIPMGKFPFQMIMYTKQYEVYMQKNNNNNKTSANAQMAHIQEQNYKNPVGYVF